MNQDPEITALGRIYEALKGLNHNQIRRIIEWATSKFESIDQIPVEALSRLGAEHPSIPDEGDEPTAPVKKRRGRQPGPRKTKPTAAPIPEPGQTGITGFMKYDSVEDLFFGSNVKTTAAKILLVAAYLQEKNNLKEITSYEINSCLKQVGQGIQNIAIPINTLMDKKPPLLIQVGKMSEGKQGKRKLRVTEEGLRIARNYLIEE